jgi:hypothetical protein
MKKIVQITGHDFDEVMSMSEEERKNYLMEIDIEENKEEKKKNK